MFPSSFPEVCSGGELPEVEIVSLLEEQIPKYTLRADTLTEFGGKFLRLKCTSEMSFLFRISFLFLSLFLFSRPPSWDNKYVDKL